MVEKTWFCVVKETEDYQKLITDKDGQRDPKEAFSDGTLQVLSSNFQPIVQVKFVDLFPIH